VRVDAVRERCSTCGCQTPPPLEVDVVPVEPEDFAAAQAGVGEEGEQEPVALAPAGEVARPDVVALDDGAADRSPSQRSRSSVTAPRVG
jgi:hypothetical protein